jgi:hypothetical protein
VVHLQLPLGSYDIVGAETFVKQISEDAKFPIITGIINQGRLWKNAFQAEVIGEEPDQATAGGHYRILIERATDAEHAEDFIFLEWESEKGFPGYIEIVAVDVILKIESWINLDTHGSVIVHRVLEREISVHSLQVVRQTVISTVEVEPFVFNSCPEIPLAGDEEAVRVAEIVVERIAVSKLAVVVVETTVSGVVHLVIKKIAVIFVCWRG